MTKKNPLGDVAAALGEVEMRASELVELVGSQALTIAWTGGYVEFGHRDYTVTGNPTNPKTHAESELHVESGESWTGAKTAQQCPLRALPHVVEMLIKSAYMQGINDAAQVVDRVVGK